LRSFLASPAGALSIPARMHGLWCAIANIIYARVHPACILRDSEAGLSPWEMGRSWLIVPTRSADFIHAYVQPFVMGAGTKLADCAGPLLNFMHARMHPACILRAGLLSRSWDEAG
jgi:hypothetical protein